MFKNISELEGVKLLKKEEQRVVLGGALSTCVSRCSSGCNQLHNDNRFQRDACDADCEELCEGIEQGEVIFSK